MDLDLFLLSKCCFQIKGGVSRVCKFFVVFTGDFQGMVKILVCVNRTVHILSVLFITRAVVPVPW